MSYQVPTSHHLHPGYGHELTRQWQTTNTKFDKSTFVYPIFVVDEDGQKNEIKSMPEQYQWSVDRLDELLEPLVKKGLRSVILFGVITAKDRKDAKGSGADHEQGPVVRAIKKIRATYPQVFVICDVCLCQFTSHGHCGVFGKAEGADLDNAASVQRLAEVAGNYALAGAHMVAPSDMMDGRIGAIKNRLREIGKLRECSVMAYSAKFASCMYGPFRDAAHSTPGFGDRRSYQLPVGANGLAVRALLRDAEEGADFIMVKPGGPYLDIIKEARDRLHVPISAYQVSGEYAMIWHAAAAGSFELKRAVYESITCLRRAGAEIIITYYTPKLLDWLDE